MTRIGIIGDAGLGSDGELIGAARIAEIVQDFGARAALAALAPSDANGDQLLARLQRRGVDVSRIERSNRSALAMGDYIDVAGLFAMDAVLIAVSDARLHRFLVDLPVHTSPNARLAGLIDRLVCSRTPDAIETVLRQDMAIGSDSAWLRLLDVESIEEGKARIRAMMTGANLRAAVWHADRAASIVTKDERLDGEVGDAVQFIARALVAFARRAPWPSLFPTSDER